MEVSALSYYLNTVWKTPCLSEEEENFITNVLYTDPENKEEARELLIKTNLRLVVSIAKKHKNTGIPLDELISEGNIGLVKAIDKFNPTKGNKLSTYATWWIRQYVIQCIQTHGRTIRVPPHASEKIRRVKLIIKSLTNELQRTPSLEEISQETKIEVEKLETIIQWSHHTISLDQAAEDPNFNLEKIRTDDSVCSPDTELHKKSDSLVIRKILEELPQREKEILEYRYGFKDGTEKTLEEIGEIYGVTRERIRQIEFRGLQKVKIKLEKLSINDKD
jgi:RNA polymerase primary sigma factor